MITPLESAIQLAVKAHTGQIDEGDGMPHIVHCFEVFHRVQEMFDGRMGRRLLPPKIQGSVWMSADEYSQEEIMIAAILHDTVEDSFENPTALERVDLERIEAMFGKNVRDIVDSVTRRKLTDGTKETYRDFIYRAKANKGGILVKIADLGHNSSRNHKIKSASWRKKLDFKYAIAMSVLNDTNQPTWEQASSSVQYEGPHAHYFVADPNGKKIEVSEEEFKTLTRRKDA